MLSFRYTYATLILQKASRRHISATAASAAAVAWFLICRKILLYIALRGCRRARFSCAKMRCVMAFSITLCARAPYAFAWRLWWAAKDIMRRRVRCFHHIWYFQPRRVQKIFSALFPYFYAHMRTFTWWCRCVLWWRARAVPQQKRKDECAIIFTTPLRAQRYADIIFRHYARGASHFSFSLLRLQLPFFFLSPFSLPVFHAFFIFTYRAGFSHIAHYYILFFKKMRYACYYMMILLFRRLCRAIRRIFDVLRLFIIIYDAREKRKEER